MIKKCIMLDGKIINVGAWDYKIEKKPVGNIVAVPLDEKGEATTEVFIQTLDENNEPIFEEIIHNPMPEGALEQDVDIDYTAAERIALVIDYAEFRRAEYPTIGDQLDALWKGGTALEEMRSTVMAVKDKYPKPTQQ